jgi:type IV pilus assembly protein PilA
MSTTTHPFAPEEIMALLDGELPADRAESVSAHVAECAECSTLGNELRGLSHQLATWQVGPVPERTYGLVTATLTGNSTRTDPGMSVVNQRRTPVLRFAVQIASAIGAVLIVMAIAVPNLLRSRMAANEASAVGSLRTLNTAAVTYFSIYGHYPPSLENFGGSQNGLATENEAGLIDDVLARGGPKSGYLFTYRASPAFGPDNKGGYTINADPLEPGKSAQRHFSTDETGVIRFDGGQALDGGSPETPQANGPRAAGEQGIVRSLAETAPMIARRAELRLMVAKLDEARKAMDQILVQHKGYVAQLSASAETGSERMVVASLRVPASELDSCIAGLKKLGNVTQESQEGEEVTQQHVDLLARLKNSRNTETRLHNVLQQPGGKIKDILDVEKESARVRGEIEQMEAQQQTLEHRVEFATIDLKLAEEYKAQLSSPAPSVASQVRNASVNGFRNAFESLLALILFFAEAAPTLLLWLTLLAAPAWLFWWRYRRSLAVS